MYLFLKHVHITCVILSVSLFILRYLGQCLGLAFVRGKTLRILPHAIDTVLLLSALSLALYLHQYPFVHAWLTAKVLALVAYIGLGVIAMRKSRGGIGHFAAFILALVCVTYIVSVARSHDAWGFFGQWRHLF